MELSKLTELNNLVGQRDRLISWVNTLSNQGGDIKILVRSEVVNKDAVDAAQKAMLPIYQKELTLVEEKIKALGVELTA